MIFPFPYLPSFCSMLFQSPSPTSFQRPFEHATAATRHHYQNVWCIKYLPVIYCSCLYLCSSLISFAFSLIFLPFVPCFSNLHLPLHSNNHHLLTFDQATAATRHIITMDDHEYTKKSNAANARMKRKRIMQHKRHTYFWFPVQPTIHPTPQNQLYSDADLCSTNLDINKSTSAHHLAPAIEDQGKKLNISFKIKYQLTLPNYYLLKCFYSGEIFLLSIYLYKLNQIQP